MGSLFGHVKISISIEGEPDRDCEGCSDRRNSFLLFPLMNRSGTGNSETDKVRRIVVVTVVAVDEVKHTIVSKAATLRM